MNAWIKFLHNKLGNRRQSRETPWLNLELAKNSRFLLSSVFNMNLLKNLIGPVELRQATGARAIYGRIAFATSGLNDKSWNMVIVLKE